MELVRTSVTRCFTFEAAHQLPWHPGKCRNLHGHGYRLEVTVEGPVNDDGMVLDFAVYTPLREHNWPAAVVASNAVGLLCDSVLFLWIAFGNFDFLPGQIVGKTWVTLAFLPLLVIWRNQWRELVGVPA